MVSLPLITRYVTFGASFLCMGGNALVLMTIGRTPSLRKKDCIFLMGALASADFLIGLISFYHGNANCTVRTLNIPIALIFVSSKVNRAITLAMAIDRIYAIYWPLKYKFLQHRKITLGVWLVATIYALIPISVVYVQRFAIWDQVMPSCTPGVILPAWYKKEFSYFNVGWGILFSIAYFSVVQGLRGKPNEAYKQATKASLMVMLASLLLITIPYFLMTIDAMVGFGAFQKLGPVVACVDTLNGSVNVIIYCWKYKPFRKAMLATLVCKNPNEFKSSIKPAQTLSLARKITASSQSQQVIVVGHH